MNAWDESKKLIVLRSDKRYVIHFKIRREAEEARPERW